MKVVTTFRHLEATEALKNHVEDKLAKFRKYLIRPIEAHVILSVQKIRQSCEIILTASNFHATAVDTSHDLYASIDSAMHKIEGQVRRHKEKMKHHKDHLPVHETAAIAEEFYEGRRD